VLSGRVGNIGLGYVDDIDSVMSYLTDCLRASLEEKGGEARMTGV